MTDTIKRLQEVREALEYEQVDAWVERSDGLFEYRGCNGHGLEEAIFTLDAVIAQIDGSRPMDTCLKCGNEFPINEAPGFICPQCLATGETK